MRDRLLGMCLTLCSAAVQAAEVDSAAALHALAQPAAVLIDVRSAEEFASGAMPGATLIPHGEIVRRISEVAPDKNTPLVLYCHSGRRSGIAQDALRALGYTQVVNAGGYSQFQQARADR